MFKKELLATQMAASDVDANNPEFLPLVTAMLNIAERNDLVAAAVTVPGDLLKGLAGDDKAVIVVALSSRANIDVAQILDGDGGGVFNHNSDDLLTSTTFLSIGSDGNELWLETSRLLPSALDYEEGSFVVVVFRGDSVWRRRFVLQDFDEFGCGLQGAEGSSGLNYQPYRIWTDAQLEEAASKAKEQQQQVGSTPLMPLSLTYTP